VEYIQTDFMSSCAQLDRKYRIFFWSRIQNNKIQDTSQEALQDF